MKSTTNSSRVLDRYSLIEPLEARIAPAAATVLLPANPVFVTATAGSALLIKAGEVLTTGSGGSGAYLLYVAQGEVLVHTTDLNHNNAVDFNEITGLSVSNGAIFVPFTDIHGDIVTDLNPNGTLDDGGKGDILMDANITEIDMRSLTTADFPNSSDPAAMVNAHLAMSNYSIFGSIYAGGGLGLANNASTGLVIDNSGVTTQQNVFNGGTGANLYTETDPYVGNIFVGTAASGQPFTFGASGSSGDVFGNLLTFNPASGEAGASIYNVSTAVQQQPFNIGTLQAGNGGFNAGGGNIANVTLYGNTYGTVELIAGNGGPGTTGHAGGSIINFSAADIVVGEVVLQSGNGGTGLTGTGGNAGAITLAAGIPVGINAHMVLNYGSGGDGYTAGGTGGGTPAGTFDVTDGKLTQAQNLVSTLHNIGSIGTTTPFDFNGDGYSDAVFSTTNPNQVVVAFGNANNGLASVGINDNVVGSNFGLNYQSYLYLNAPGQVDSIVVGNFTGKINPFTHQPEEDIAVASGNANYAGVYVYLSEYSPKTGAFEGFSSPLFTPLPSLTATGSQADNGFTGYFYTSNPITEILAGDFTGNGVLGLAVVAQETVPISNRVDSVIIFLNGETNATHPGGSGYFYANYVDGLPPIIDFNLYINQNFNATKSIFEVTALQSYTPTTPGSITSNGHDVIVMANLGEHGYDIIDDSTGIPIDGFYEFPDAFGRVDTNRSLPQTTLSLQNFLVQGISIIQDQNTAPGSPYIADFAALAQSPVGFLELFQGNGTDTGFTLTTGNGTLLAGIDFDYGFGGANPVAIRTVPNAATGLYSNLAILDYNAAGGDLVYVLNVDPLLMSIDGGLVSGLGADTVEWVVDSPAGGRDANTVAFDVYYPHPVAVANIPGSGPLSFGFITANPLDSYPNDQDFAVSQPYYTDTIHGVTYNVGGGFNLAPFKVAGLFFNGGNGGNSQAGAGGNGGSFGTSLTVLGSGSNISAVGTLAIQLPMDPTFEGTVEINAGNGGNGFTHAGTGGNLVGISVTYEPGTTLLTALVDLTAGNGGESLTGVGGNGGSESQLFVYSGEIFTAGNGGIGVVGGAGGAILGNPQSNLITAEANSITAYVAVLAGYGASGITGGGSGGSINYFTNDFDALAGGVGGTLIFVAGSAGDAVAGTGGTGGSLFSDSPSNLDNNLAGPIYLLAGQGGNGLSGGGGGNITTFVNTNTIGESPTIFTIVGGFAGNGTLGNGGTGGSISGVTVSASGNTSTTEIVNGESMSVSTPSYNRLIAGSGGTSQGATGGAGGSLNTINTAATATNTEDVGAAGAGGGGLLAGGNGGSLTNVDMDAGSASGSTSGKVLAIAGDGGDSTSAKPLADTPVDIANAVGGVNGPGGNGGSITGFSQPTSVQTHVDLIAGNGGATLAHSVFAGNATVDNSGAGGSITNVSVAGSIGNPENISGSPVPIVSYNNIFTGIAGGYSGTQVAGCYTMQEFVDNYILGSTLPGTYSLVPFNPINDTVGNVGLVAGAAGRVEGATSIAPTVASTDGVDGSVSNVHAENIMSMIAGNVDQVAAIQNLSNFGVISGGVLGAAIPSYFNPIGDIANPAGFVETAINGAALSSQNVNYLNVNGGLTNNPLVPTDGGELIDGAIIAVNLPTNPTQREF
jgi:hypothetical protein